MAGTSGITTGRQTKLYYKATNLAEVDETNVLALVADANEVTRVTEVGDLGQSANSFEFAELGKEARTKVAGAPSNDDFTFSVAIDRSNAVHKALYSTAIGTAGDLVISIAQGTSGDKQTVYYLKTSLAGKGLATPVDDGVHQYNFTFSLEDSPKVFDKS